MWFMTPTGLVQLSQAPSQGLEMAAINTVPPSPGSSLNQHTATSPVQLATRGLRPIAPKLSSGPVPITLPNQPHPLPEPPICNPRPLAPPSVQPSDLDHGLYSLPFCPPRSSTNFSPLGTVRVDAPQSRPLRKEVLEIDPSLIFVESPAAINDWLSGSGGVVVPGLSLSLPYLPPFVSNLSMLSRLLCAKKSLTRSSLQLVREGNKSRWPQTNSKPDSSTKNGSNDPPPQPPPDLPDSTSDITPAEKHPGNTPYDPTAGGVSYALNSVDKILSAGCLIIGSFLQRLQVVLFVCVSLQLPPQPPLSALTTWSSRRRMRRKRRRSWWQQCVSW